MTMQLRMSYTETKMIEVRAYHKPTSQWRWCCLGNNGKYVRLDPLPGEHLHDFDVYEVNVIKKTEDTEEFRPTHNLNHLERVLS